jgi:shikimate dehydrogenase
MAVSKEELFAKYKELKAQGVSITLMELKKQLESERQPSQTEAVPPSPSVANVETAGNNSGFSSLNSTSGLSSLSNSTTSQKENSSWTTSYSAPLPQVSSPSAYSGNVVTKENSNYTNNFSGDFSFGQTKSTNLITPQSQPKTPYTGNFHPQADSNQTPKTNEGKYGLIGYPLGHSLSTYIHNAGFKSLGLNYTYEILETPPDTLVDRIKFLKANNYSGFNVTIPLKLPVALFLDEIDASADIIGAINTVVINPDKTMKGYNTDVIGFRRAIPDDIVLFGKIAGVMGTGGAARAAITALAQAQVKEIRIFTRSVPNSIELLAFLRKRFPNVEFNAHQIEFIRDLSDIDILVNTTPIGMQGRAADLTPVEENELKTLPQGAVVYDVIYNPKKTLLLRLAEKNGYRTINGVEMFIHQAAVSEEIWTGRTPDFKDMKIAVLENL